MVSKGSSKRRAVGLGDELGKRGSFDSAEQEAYLNLLRTVDELSGEFARLFRAHGVTDPQYNALRILRGHGTRITMRTIAEEMVTREPDITRLVDRLERAGWAKRERCAHARSDERKRRGRTRQRR